ncbi:hypothetical protein BGZ80_003241 [Entomortierella chlamydospora]|uniref:AB hydrolase-1 domain-containing protein n=1 Tax=Entomortierella chlamydospora TaxID=101097 RepID=A0A9P6N234_9FUNG|nr:hypothetical protein BGZ79_001162 [Entomortierella chlamydospora]KAG0020986.1 hypothetical protein BGZ80_003241 [Entomortierella chlamydospora]
MVTVQFDPSKFNHQTAICGGYKYHYVDEGNKNGTPVVLVHGFPDLWYGWRYQIDFLVALGLYRVIALDLLGYGETDKPQCENPADLHPAYTPKTVASHIVELLDHLGVQKAVMIGHDWGTGIVSRIGWHFPERVHCTVAIGNPFRPITKNFITISDLTSENPAFQYFEYFTSPEAVKDFDEKVEDIVDDLFSEENGNSEQDRSYYLENLKKGGFNGPLSYYKCFEASHREDLYLLGQRFKIPSLLLIVNNDPILSPEYCRQVPTDYFDNLEIDEIDVGEHWILTQNPECVNRKIGIYLDKLFGLEIKDATSDIASGNKGEETNQSEQTDNLKKLNKNRGGRAARFGRPKL